MGGKLTKGCLLTLVLLMVFIDRISSQRWRVSSVMASGFHIYCLQRIWDKLLSQVEEFKYLGVLFMSKGRVEHEID